MAATRKYPRRAFGSTVPSTLADYISALAPRHWWKTDETAAPLVDSGSSSIAMTQVGSVTYQLAGPDASSKGLDFVGGSNRFTSTSALSSLSSGSVVAFVKGSGGVLTSSTAIITQSNLTNEYYTMVFGINPQGTGTAHRIGCCFSTEAFVWRRHWSGSTATNALSSSTWHMFVWTADGVGTMKMYVDSATEETVSEFTSGTPPAATTFLAAATGVDSRAVIGNCRLNSSSGEWGQRMSHVAIFSSVLTPTQIGDMLALKTL